MAALITDKFTETTNGTRPDPTTVTSTRSAAATTLQCAALTGWPTATAVHFATYRTNAQGEKVAGSQCDWKGIVSGTQITNLTLKAGTDTGNSIGDTVVCMPTAAWAKDLADGLIVSHDQDGTLKAGAVDNAAVLASNVVTTAKILDANVTTAKLADASITNAKLSTTAGELGGSWTAWTPTITAASGSFTTTSAAGRWMQIGKTVFFNVNITITTVGAGTGLTFSLPVTAYESDKLMGGFREGAITGYTGVVRLTTTTQGILNEYDNAQALANGNIFYCNGFYEAA